MFNKKEDDFDASSYVKVNVRLAQFRKEYPNGFLTTFQTEDKSGKGMGYKAVICRNKEEAEIFATTSIAAATGHSYATYEQLNGEKVMEYLETVACGRALALLGYQVEKSIASEEEMHKFQEIKKHKEVDKTPPAPKAEPIIEAKPVVSVEPKTPTEDRMVEEISEEVKDVKPKMIGGFKSRFKKNVTLGG